MRVIAGGVVWRSFLMIAVQTGIWEARNPGVAIRDGSHVISGRRLLRRAEVKKVGTR